MLRIRPEFALCLILLAGCSGARPGMQHSGGPFHSREDAPLLFISDTQRTGFLEFWREQNESERRALFAALPAENPAAIFFLGDLVFQGDSESHWKWFDEYTAAIRRAGIPAFPLPGNHEYFGNDRLSLEHYFNRFPHLNRRLWYSVRAGYAAVILLNSNLEHLDAVQISAQRDWYRKELTSLDQDTSVSCIVVCTHHPAFTNSTEVDGSDAVREQFVDPFLRSRKGALFISGHAHAYQHFILEGRHLVVSGGGGGPRQTLDSMKHQVPLRDAYAGSAIRFFHFCRLVATRDAATLQVKGFSAAGEPVRIMDEFRIDLHRMQP